MAKNITDVPPPDADPELEKRVGMIMGEKNADGITPAKPLDNSPIPPPIDIFANRGAPVGTAPVTTTPSADTPFDDNNTAKAVDEIVAKEGDTLLAVEDTENLKAAQRHIVNPERSKFKRLITNKWLWIVSILVVIIAVAVVPYTRYTLLGLVIKNDVTLMVVDSKNGTTVSNAQVSLHGQQAKTDASGKVVIRAPIGNTKLIVTKQYYKNYTASYFVSYKAGQTSKVELVASGRRVPVTVVNRITGKPLAGATISVLDTTAKTDQKGQAVIVLPTTDTSFHVDISLNGYHTVSGAIVVTDQAVKANTFNMLPSGSIYFLSNLSGKIDVVKSDLDGSNRTTVLAGTGKEDPNATILMASRDWRYLVLSAIRDTPQPALYLIDTSTDKVINFDSGNSTFTLLGWTGHNFLYDVIRNNVVNSQSGHEALKGYNAETGQINLLDQNQAEGTTTAFAFQGFYNFNIINGLLAYNTQWYTGGTAASSVDLSTKNDSIRTVQANGQPKRDAQTFPANTVSYMQAVLTKPQIIDYAVFNPTTNTASYYAFDGQTVTASPSGVGQSVFSQAYPIYLISPSGSQTFWSELRDGKKSLFIGDQNAGGPKLINSTGDYTAYGWYSDNYLLVSYSGSELYIMAADSSSATNPLKITDYYKPTTTYNGYNGQ